jgi:hypothetical protein
LMGQANYPGPDQFKLRTSYGPCTVLSLIDFFLLLLGCARFWAESFLL